MPIPLPAVTTNRLAPVTANLTESDLCRNVMRMLGESSWTEVINAAVTSSSTTLTLTSDATTRWRVGDVGEFRDDGERFVVTTAHATTPTVRRGHDFTTAAAHASATVIAKHPRFWWTNVCKAVNDAVQQDLFPELFATYEAQLTADPTNTLYYVLPEEALDIFRVYQRTDSSTPQDISFNPDDEVQILDGTTANTSRAIRLGWLSDRDNTIYCQYSRVPAIADLSVGMARIVEYGACARLLSWEAAQTSGKRRAADYDRAGMENRTAAWFLQEQIRLKGQEAAQRDTLEPRRVPRYISPRVHIR